jgi:hypothetical protein
MRQEDPDSEATNVFARKRAKWVPPPPIRTDCGGQLPYYVSTNTTRLQRRDIHLAEITADPDNVQWTSPDVGGAPGGEYRTKHPEHLRFSEKIRALTAWLQKSFGDPPYWDAPPGRDSPGG